MIIAVNFQFKQLERRSLEKSGLQRDSNPWLPRIPVSEGPLANRWDETIQICLEKLYALPDPPTLPRLVFKVLLAFATKRSHFIFNGQYYDQIDSVAMGSPLGPVLANIFMCYFEEKWVLNNNAHPSVWFRYVDDTFTLAYSTIKPRQPSSCTTSITNLPMNLKRTIQFLSWTFSSNDTITLSQHLFTERRPLPACTQNGTPSHLGNTK